MAKKTCFYRSCCIPCIDTIAIAIMALASRFFTSFHRNKILAGCRMVPKDDFWDINRLSIEQSFWASGTQSSCAAPLVHNIIHRILRAATGARATEWIRARFKVGRRRLPHSVCHQCSTELCHPSKYVFIGLPSPITTSHLPSSSR